MKSPNSIEVEDLQSKIDRKLIEIRNRNLHPNKTRAKKTNESDKKVAEFKWNTIKKHILGQLQKTHKNSKRGQKNFKIIRPALNNGDLLDVINRIQLLQKYIIELSTAVGNYRRLQMLCVFFQCALSIIFNSYTLVVFLLKMANRTANVPLSLAMLVIFFGYHIFSSMADIIFSVMAYSGVYDSIRKTAAKMDELNIYIFESEVNSKISQLTTYVFNNLRTFTLFGLYNIDGTFVTSIISGTTTYIIILIQYSGDGEICKAEVNSNMNNTENRS